jgi:hypothetical protein
VSGGSFGESIAILESGNGSSFGESITLNPGKLLLGSGSSFGEGGILEKGSGASFGEGGILHIAEPHCSV